MSSIWNENFVLNIPQIDEQHKKFFELFERVSSDFEGKDRKSLTGYFWNLKIIWNITFGKKRSS